MEIVVMRLIYYSIVLVKLTAYGHDWDIKNRSQ